MTPRKSKRLRTTTDPFVGVLIIAPKSERDEWARLAALYGKSLSDFCRAWLNRSCKEITAAHMAALAEDDE